MTSPRRGALRTPPPRAGRHEIDEQTGVGEVYMRSLLRAQLRLALLTCTTLGVLLGGVPLLLAVQPGLRSARLLGVPLPWLLLGVLVYPALVAGGWLHLRAAERNERDFAALVEGPVSGR